MDTVQIHHLALLYQNARDIWEVELAGAGPSIREEMVEELLAED